jgi:Ca2+-binding RTX toxin-like protein
VGSGSLDAGSFVSEAGAQAHDANDFIVYDSSTGALYYDSDGSGAQLQVQFATLIGHPTITAGDIVGV